MATGQRADTAEKTWLYGKVHWNKIEGEGWAPLYKWKSITFEGPVRPFKAFLEGERMAVLRYFMCRIAEHLFDCSPLQLVVNEQTGAFSFQNDENWDKLPFMIETEDGFEMNDGSMKIAKKDKANPDPGPGLGRIQGMPNLAETAQEGFEDSPHNWPEDDGADDLEMKECSSCGNPFTGSKARTECKLCATEGPASAE